MIWSKLKKMAESMLADSLRGRIQYHTTRYGAGLSNFMRRGWITFDNDEIADFSTIKRIRDSHEISGEWFSSDQQVIEALDQQGIFSRDTFVEALEAIVAMQDEIAIGEVI